MRHKKEHRWIDFDPIMAADKLKEQRDHERMAFADHVYAASEPDNEFLINLREKGKLDYMEGLEAEIEEQRDNED